MDSDHLHFPPGKHLASQRNDFALLVQAYRQHPGTRNVNGGVQDDTIGLLGAELNHYMTDRVFWWVKTAGAFRGNPNGYMDLLGGLGYRWPLGSGGLATGKIGLGVQHTLHFLNQRIKPFVELFVGAGGGGGLALGGGALVEAVLGLHYALTPTIGLTTSISQLKAISDDLNTTVFTLGITINFATLTRGNGS